MALVRLESAINEPVVYPLGGSSVTAGRLLEATGTGRQVQHAGANSVRVVGVAGSDASANTGVTAGRSDIFKVSAASAVTMGDKLVAAANGQVAAAGATPDARTIVGEALESVASGNVRAFIY
jgi:hypothetical protein